MTIQENIVGKRVLVKCPAYNRGKPCTGTVKGVKKDPTLYILFDGNLKCTSIAKCWIKNIL